MSDRELFLIGHLQMALAVETDKMYAESVVTHAMKFADELYPIDEPAAGEPVAWMTRPLRGSSKGKAVVCQADHTPNLELWEKPFPVYAEPPAAGEPVRVVVEPGEELSPSNLVGNRIDRMLTIGTRLYTAPPPRHRDKAVRDVLAERHRQITDEHFSPVRDDAYTGGQLASAGAAYALIASEMAKNGSVVLPACWPWDACWLKPSTPRRNLVKAAALIIAEIQRLDRAERPLGDNKGEASPA